MTISSVRFSQYGAGATREVNKTAGEGVRTKSVDLNLPNGNSISRTKTATIAEDGSKTVTGSVSVTRGDTTKTADYTRTVSADRMIGELTITGPKGNTRTITFDRNGGIVPPTDTAKRIPGPEGIMTVVDDGIQATTGPVRLDYLV